MDNTPTSPAWYEQYPAKAVSDADALAIVGVDELRHIRDILWYVAAVALEDAQDVVSALEAARGHADGPTIQMLHAQAGSLYSTQRDVVRRVTMSYSNGDARWSQLDSILPHSLREPSCAEAIDRAHGCVEGWRREAGQRMDTADRAAFRQETEAAYELATIMEAEAKINVDAESMDAILRLESARKTYEWSLENRHWLPWVGYTGAAGYVVARDAMLATVRRLTLNDVRRSSDKRRKPGPPPVNVPYELISSWWQEFYKTHGRKPTNDQMRNWLADNGYAMQTTAWGNQIKRYRDEGLIWPPQP